jgi:hypothetical protein
LNNVQLNDAGLYAVSVSNSPAGSSSSASANATLTLTSASRISNLSVRTNLAAGQGLTVGFVTNGLPQLLIRAVGPSLNQVFGVTDYYPDPQFSIVSQGTTLAKNDFWSPNLSFTFSSVGAFPLVYGSADAALSLQLNGPNTAEVSGTGPGLLLVEIYDAKSYVGSARLVNVSARNQVGTGADILVSGFVIDGTAPKKLLIRGIGPGLHDVFGLTGTLTDPVLEVHQTINGQDTVVAKNDDWDASLTTTFDQVGAYHFTAGSKDAALVVTLQPGVYTAQVSGTNNGTGIGVVEVYEVPN